MKNPIILRKPLGTLFIPVFQHWESTKALTRVG